MPDSILSWLKSYELAGTWADVAGLLGFGITIVAALKARNAAIAAKNAAENTRDKIRLFSTLVDFQTVISAIEEIKRLHRQGNAWSAMPEKYSATRRNLILLGGSGLNLSDKQTETIQLAIVNLSAMERQVERSLGNNTPLRGDKLNALLSDDGDSLLRVLQDLKKQGGGF